MITLGIDLGSNTVKAALVLDGSEILAHHVERTRYDVESVTRRCVAACLDASGYSLEQCEKTVATGYGRISCTMADRNVSEITCHARGAWYYDHTIRTVIDIGGQDSKVITLSPAGKMIDFVMNDKCAAGTGRFLEVMARALDTSLSDLAELGRRATSAVSISNTCTVFAESEVIGLMARRQPKEDIIAGLHASIAQRVGALANRLRITDRVALTGGVALNEGVKEALEETLERKLVVPPAPQVVGAVGAALVAAELVAT